MPADFCAAKSKLTRWRSAISTRTVRSYGSILALHWSGPMTARHFSLFRRSKTSPIAKKTEEELRKAVAEIEKLHSGLLKICAWTKQIEVNGRWVPVDEFLRDFLQLKLTHGISDRGLALYERQCKGTERSRPPKD